MTSTGTTPTAAGRVPANAAPGTEHLSVLEERYSYPPPSDDSLITISTVPGLTQKQFNTVANSLTREVTVTGIELRWDGTCQKLADFTVTRDVTKFTIIADVIRIATPLRWKGANVEIFARLLVFSGQGCIDTTPESYPDGTMAFSEFRDADGRPLDKAGSVTIKAKDGRPGEKGGDIAVYVAGLNTGGMARCGSSAMGRQERKEKRAGC